MTITLPMLLDYLKETAPGMALVGMLLVVGAMALAGALIYSGAREDDGQAAPTLTRERALERARERAWEREEEVRHGETQDSDAENVA